MSIEQKPMKNYYICEQNKSRFREFLLVLSNFRRFIIVERTRNEKVPNLL